MKKFFVLCLFLSFIVSFAACSSGNDTSQTGQNNKSEPSPASSTSSDSQSTSSTDSSQEEVAAVFSLAEDTFPPESLSDILVTDVKSEIFVQNSATSIPWEDMELTAQQLSTAIQDNLDLNTSVVYIQDDEGNNLLTVINGKTTYNAGGDNGGSGFNPSTITLEEFDAIQTGMGYQEVFDIVGGRGTVLSEVDLGLGSEYYTVIYQWEGEGAVGANANVTFQGGTVSAKAQFGLE